ncbi:hypothetical protein KVP10_08305 [Candidimonas humi]|uniref:Uncharacterized protein n=1 Tax=Candidimonas humi TaxID=683355 RepID=A0ABV8NUM7_9BURK|nr:hypothetical protein [Candidimonas humi]MBV6304887.1 hypothetical protein [Candidimonas humi]
MSDTQLWAILIEEPDDLYAMPSLKDAQAHINILRPSLEKLGLSSKVVPWPHSAESHAQNLTSSPP